VKPFGILDRYVLRQWSATFVLSAIGIPAVSVLINTADNFGRFTDRGVPLKDIFLGQLFLFPTEMSVYIPAAVLFATVFTINGMGRHSELTAAKAGGVSFYRLILPMMLLAVLAIPVTFALQEAAAGSKSRQRVLVRDKLSPTELYRYGFGYASPSRWTWAVSEMTRKPAQMHRGLLVEGPIVAGRRWTLAADSASWGERSQQWRLFSGVSVMIDTATGDTRSFRFASLRHRALTETPGQLMDEGKKAEEMTMREFREYLAELSRSGKPPGALAVEWPLKYAIPFACIVIALFGAPLAITTPRAGAAVGLAFALGTMLVYLTGIQIMKALGGKEIIAPDLAAWSMNGLFLLLAIVLMSRVRS
jgi:lipopolysaccharide export system permease protein